MFKKTAITLAVFLALGLIVLGAVSLASPGVVALASLDAETLCPVAGCSLDGACHGYSSVPVPDGVHEMVCPEAKCAGVECHAWDSLVGRYHQASDASLNVWIMLPALLVVALVVIARKVGNRE